MRHKVPFFSFSPSLSPSYPINSSVSLMSSLWNPRSEIRTFKVPQPFPAYEKKFDELQERLAKLSVLDELWSG